MGIKVVVEKRGEVWLISDGGVLAGALGNIPAPLSFVVGQETRIGPMVSLMEAVIGKFLMQQQDLLEKNKPAPAPVNRVKKHLGNGNGNVSAAVKRPVAVGKKPLSLEDLGLKNQQLWRLKAAKITSISKLGMLTVDQLGAKKGIGPAIVKAVSKGLKKHGLRLTTPVG